MSSVMLIILTLGVLSTLGYALARRQALATAHGARHRLHSLPSYHGLYVALWILLPAAGVLLLWLFFEGWGIRTLVLQSLPKHITNVSAGQRAFLLADIHSLASDSNARPDADPVLQAAAAYYARLHSWSHRLLPGLVLVLAIGGWLYSRQRIAADLRARNLVERVIMALLGLCAIVAILTTVGIVLSLVFEAVRFFTRVPPSAFFFGLQWSPQTAIHAEQVGASGAFGVIPLLAGTLLIMAIAMTFAIPIGLLAAIYMAEFASPGLRAVAKPVLEMLAGIPTVVYGFFAALTVAPLLSQLGASIGLAVSSQSALAAGSVMGIMIIPFVSSLSDDFIHAVPQQLRDGALALGATRAETVRYVVVPAALPGIAGAIILAVSVALGETMIVLMAAGLYANLTANPLEAVTTITVQIATLLTGDQEFNSAKTLCAFALGLFLFVLTLGLNIIAITLTRRYREHYE
jgi:phosphate transport system permease protein